MTFLSNVNPELLGNIVHVVPDLETFSTKPNASIRSIGAVAICNGKIIGEFYVNVIEPENLYRWGFSVDQDTVDWWNKPENEEAQKAFADDQRPIKQAIELYQQWLCKVNATYSWGYSSEFDNVILGSAFKLLCIENPIEWYNHRCLRTLTTTLDIPINRDKGVHHNALADAINQGQALIKCFKKLEAFEYIEQNITNPHCCR